MNFGSNVAPNYGKGREGPRKGKKRVFVKRIICGKVVIRTEPWTKVLQD